eukprot:1259438-Rhodomonas_salina.1
MVSAHYRMLKIRRVARRQEHIEELEKNLKVLYGSDERARELEHYNKVPPPDPATCRTKAL